MTCTASRLRTHRAQADRIWRQRLERAEIAADRTRRQYQLAEPENRLVVRQLEKDWETALAERESWAKNTTASAPPARAL